MGTVSGMRCFLMGLWLYACISAVWLPAATTGRLYVSTQGNDMWSGHLSAPSAEDGPLATLAAALQRRRAARESPQPVSEIILRGGTYYLTATLQLNVEDSGTKECPLVIKAHPGEHPRIVGGIRLEPQAGTKPGEPLVFDFDAAQVQASENRDISRLGRNLPIFEVFAQRQRLQIARWPNWDPRRPYGENWAYVGRVDRQDASPHFFASALPSEAIQLPPGEGSIHVFSQPDWFDQIMDITDVDTASRQITLAASPRYVFNIGSRFAILDAHAALDAPGEWWFDRKYDRLLVLPPAEGLREIEVSTLMNLLNIDGTCHLRIEAISWEICTGTAIILRGGGNITIIGNAIGLTGQAALDARTQGALLVSSNLVWCTGRSGIVLEGGDRDTLGPSHITACENRVVRIGERLKCYDPAFRLAGVGVAVIRNWIADSPHNAVMFSGNEHRIEDNLIENVARETNDVGAIYAGRDWSTRGNRIIGNTIRDLSGWELFEKSALDQGRQRSIEYAIGHQVHGVYLDDMLEDTIVCGNVFERISSGAVHLGGGGYTTIRYNRFSHVGAALFVSARNAYETALERLLPYRNNPVWIKKYPAIVDREQSDPLTPSGIVFSENEIVSATLLYQLNRLSTNNRFADNLIQQSPPSIQADVKVKESVIQVRDWTTWNQLGFDCGAAKKATDPVIPQRRAIASDSLAESTVKPPPLPWNSVLELLDQPSSNNKADASSFIYNLPN